METRNNKLSLGEELTYKKVLDNVLSQNFPRSIRFFNEFWDNNLELLKKYGQTRRGIKFFNFSAQEEDSRFKRHGIFYNQNLFYPILGNVIYTLKKQPNSNIFILEDNLALSLCKKLNYNFKRIPLVKLIWGADFNTPQIICYDNLD